MALWKEQSSARKDSPESAPVEVTPRPEVAAALNGYAPHIEPPRPARSGTSESVIGADLSIEGSITGAGSVRLAGRFTGDVTVDGMVTIESGAKLAGGVRAASVTIAGELEGNIIKAARVDVLASGVLMGDLKADTLTLAAGARLRGHVECGWVEAPTRSNGRGTPRSSEAVADA